MAFVRKKTFTRYKGTDSERKASYYQLVESRRIGGKPRQKVLTHLGQYPSVDVALERLPVLIELAESYSVSDVGDVAKYPHEAHWVYKHRQGDTLGYLENKLRLLKGLRESGKV
jgi:hypothetical protein